MIPDKDISLTNEEIVFLADWLKDTCFPEEYRKIRKNIVDKLLDGK